jgi:hypothetical protein
VRKRPQFFIEIVADKDRVAEIVIEERFHAATRRFLR